MRHEPDEDALRLRSRRLRSEDEHEIHRSDAARPCIARLPTRSVAAQAQAQDYPNRQVNFVVPFAPGGGTDILGRLVGQKLTDRFGKPFVVENRPGAGTVTAAVQVAKAAPDGYTIMMATSGTMVHEPDHLQEAALRSGQGPEAGGADLHVPFVLVVNDDLPVHSVADLLKLAKEREAELRLGRRRAPSIICSANCSRRSSGIDMTHVPYRGTLPALNDVIAGHIQLMFSDLAPAYPLIQAGKLRALGITTAQRAVVGAGIAAARRSRRAGLRLGGLAIGRGAGRDAEGHHRQAQRRDQRGDR